jgi:predicted dienelactone hydrolase
MRVRVLVGAVLCLALAAAARARPAPDAECILASGNYPADPAAVAGIPRDHLVLEDVDRGEIPAYREVARAAGTFPLIVYSHLGGGERHEAVFRLTHLASHGFVVVSADHVDSPDGEFDEAQYENRPLDVSFLIDRFLAFSAEPGHFLEGAVDPARIGATGGSFGGYTVTVLAVGPFFRGTFTDPRVKAILPQDAPLGADYEHFAADAPALFETVTISALALGGDTLNSVPFAPGIQAFFDTLVPGPAVLGYGKLHGAIHRSFVDECDFHGSLPCFGYLLPSSYVARIVGYLAVNFFEAVLNEDAAALGRLQPAAVAAIDDLIFQSK